MEAMRYMIGIDEVGRGPLAGPVVVAAVLIPIGFRPRKRGKRPALRDSKQLTARERELWREYLALHPKVRYAVALVHPKKIDNVNISRAANEAALRAFKSLTKTYELKAKSYAVCLDGGLYLGNGRARRPAHTLVKADERIPAVAMASIFAKVHRDRMMVRLAEQYPGYGFERHKGYGTKSHYAALRNLGPTDIHRLTFIA